MSRKADPVLASMVDAALRAWPRITCGELREYLAGRNHVISVGRASRLLARHRPDGRPPGEPSAPLRDRRVVLSPAAYKALKFTGLPLTSDTIERLVARWIATGHWKGSSP